jgi:RimJ/RimL family protein N-acetyltransferase
VNDILISGDSVILRDWLPSEVDRFIYWQTHGEWRMYDGPWEGVWSSLTADQETQFRKQFAELCKAELPLPRKRALIVTKDKQPLGWVTRYGEERTPEAWMVGKGLGTEALGLWVDYLFTNSTVHCLGLDTWSSNQRMIHVAGKLGFVREGVQREAHQWQGQWLDFVHFGILRSEWEEKRASKQSSPG